MRKPKRTPPNRRPEADQVLTLRGLASRLRLPESSLRDLIAADVFQPDLRVLTRTRTAAFLFRAGRLPALRRLIAQHRKP